jgi:DnaJ-class molecular chaperone
LEYVERNGLDTHSGGFAHPSGVTFYDEAGRHAKQRRDEEIAREHDRQKAAAEAAKRGCLLPEDADTLGINIYSTKEQVLTAFKRLARLHHPDTGGSAAAFQKISHARDRAIAALRQA